MKEGSRKGSTNRKPLFPSKYSAFPDCVGQISRGIPWGFSCITGKLRFPENMGRAAAFGRLGPFWKDGRAKVRKNSQFLPIRLSILQNCVGGLYLRLRSSLHPGSHPSPSPLPLQTILEPVSSLEFETLHVFFIEGPGNGFLKMGILVATREILRVRWFR